MNWLSRLKSGLSKTSTKFTEGISGIFTKRKLDAETLAELEELLIQGDMGAKTSARIIKNFSEQRLDKEISDEDIKNTLSDAITQILNPVAKPLLIDKTHAPYVIIVV